MKDTLRFFPYSSRRNWVCCIWEDGEVKIFKSKEVAARWAETKGFKAEFGG